MSRKKWTQWFAKIDKKMLLGIVICLLVVLLLGVLQISSCQKKQNLSAVQTTSGAVSTKSLSQVAIATTESGIKVETTSGNASTGTTVVTDSAIISGLDAQAQSDTGVISASETEKLNQVKGFIEFFHYNYLFKANNETGAIDELQMQAFAISYIYQYEHQELVFDTDTFILHMPFELVEDVIKKFFDVDFTNHGAWKDETIKMENGEYLMPAKETGWTSELVLKTAKKVSDFNTEVTCEVVSPDTKSVKLIITALIEDRNGRMIMKNYKTAVPPAVTQ